MAKQELISYLKKIKSPLAVSRTTGIFRALFIAFVEEREPETGLSGTSMGHFGN